MDEKDKLLRRLLTRIHKYGYYHLTDIALVELFTSDMSVKEISQKYLVTSSVLYQQKSRLARQSEVSA